MRCGRPLSAVDIEFTGSPTRLTTNGADARWLMNARGSFVSVIECASQEIRGTTEARILLVELKTKSARPDSGRPDNVEAFEQV